MVTDYIDYVIPHLSEYWFKYKHSEQIYVIYKETL